jgi:3D (Asp-Asp-Asp) domain-containing protein
VSVAFAVHVMVLPIGCGAFCEGVNDTTATAADTGAQRAENKTTAHKELQ